MNEDQTPTEEGAGPSQTSTGKYRRLDKIQSVPSVVLDLILYNWLAVVCSGFHDERSVP